MKRDRITGILLFGLALAAFLKSIAYPLGTLRRPGGGLLPFIASVLLMGLSAVLTVQAFRAAPDEKTRPVPFFPEKEAPRKIVMGFGALLGYRYLLPVIGFGASTGVFIFFLTRFLGKYSWRISIVFAILTAVAAYFLFQVWLKIPMPRPFIRI